MHQTETTSQAVKRIIARNEECAPSQLGRLEQVVDADRLNALRDPPIEFRYCGYYVTVKADETIRTDP